MLSDAELRAFSDDGFVIVRGAVPPSLVATCVAAIHDEIRRAGVDPDEPSTWSEPVVRVACPVDAAHGEAAAQPALCEAYDQLLGPTNWVRRRVMLGGVVARFPHPDEPWDHGWHVDGGYERGDEWWLNLRSRRRGLLSLFLFSDVGPHDAPTELKAGSHLDVPEMLEPYGDEGAPHPAIAHALPPHVLDRPSVPATGHAGDVVICHPFLVHRVQWPHRLRRPRIITQVLVEQPAPFELRRPASCLVEAAILRGLDEAGREPHREVGSLSSPM